MTRIILTSDRHGNPVFCKHCKTRMIKTPDVSADYYPTYIGIVLQSHCPNCGRMIPPVEKQTDYELSNTHKYKLNTAVCNVFKLGYKQSKNIVKNHKKIMDPERYIEAYSSELAEQTGQQYTEIYCFCKKFIEN